MQGQAKLHLRSLLVFLAIQAGCVLAGVYLHDEYLRASLEANNTAIATDHSTPSQGIGRAQLPFRALSVIWIVLLQIFAGYLALNRVIREIAKDHDLNLKQVLCLDRDLSKTRDALMIGLSGLAESRDPSTVGHLERISLYSSRIAKELNRCGPYQHIVTRKFIRLVTSSSALHDVGKVGVSDGILCKEGPLTQQEREEIEQHTVIGDAYLRRVEAQKGDSEFLRMARDIARCHHEWWDGTGYPQQLTGHEIPLSARIVAVADVYDALSTRRPYQLAKPHDECIDIISAAAGTQFDPAVVAAFLAIEHDIAAIASRFRDANIRSFEDIGELDFVLDAECEIGDEASSVNILIDTLQSSSGSFCLEQTPSEKSHS